MLYYIATNSLTQEQNAIVWKHDGLYSFIPFDESNLDYQQYLSWVAEGNTALTWKPEEHDLPVVTPNG